MSYTLGEAARAVGRSKTTLQRAVQAGRLSAHRLEDGSYRIEPVELYRVYPAAPSDAETAPTPQPEASHSELAVLAERAAGLQAQLEQARDEIRDLRRRLDQEGEERRSTARLLTDQRSHPGGLWRWLRWQDD